MKNFYKKWFFKATDERKEKKAFREQKTNLIILGKPIQ